MGLADDVAQIHAESLKKQHDQQHDQDELAAQLIPAVLRFRTELAEAGQVLAQHGVAQRPVFFVSKGTRLKFSGLHGWFFDYFILVNGQIAHASPLAAVPRAGVRYVPLRTRISLGLTKNSPIVYTSAGALENDHGLFSFGSHNELQIYSQTYDTHWDAHSWLVRAVASATA